MTIPQDEATARWSRNAQRWRERFAGNDPHRKLLLDPLLPELLGDVRGKRILDAGCGEGHHCRMLARLGAVCTGVDVSSEMLAYARADEAAAPLGITYRQGDMARMDFLPTSHFDVVLTCVSVVDAQDYQGAFREFARVLKPGGTYLFFGLHPCFNAPVCGWVKDESGNRLYFKVDRYQERGSALVPWPKDRLEPTVAYHRTLGDYFNSLVESGFTVTRMVEPIPSAEALAKDPRLADLLRIPHFLVMVCRKAG